MWEILNNVPLVIAIAFAGSALVGALLALLALIPPLRRLGRRNGRARAVVIGACALLAFVISFGLGTRLYAGGMVAVVTRAEASWRGAVPKGSELQGQLQAWDENRRTILNELWLRQMAPPTSGFPCYTGQLAVCELMGELGVFGASIWGTYALFIGLSVVSAVVGGVLAWLFLRHSRPVAHRVESRRV